MSNAFILRCPSCGTRNRIPEERVGQVARCGKCKAALSTDALKTDRPVIAFFPGAEFGPAKQWPLDYFRDLALKLAEAGYQIWIFGGPQDEGHARRIIQANPGHVHDLTGKTSLNDAIDLIAAAQIAVTNDSGLMHIAAAVGVHVEVIYGSTTPDYTPPLTDHKKIHYLGIACSPCFKRKCPLGHFRCMKDILPQELAGAVDRAARKRKSQG